MRLLSDVITKCTSSVAFSQVLLRVLSIYVKVVRIVMPLIPSDGGPVQGISKLHLTLFDTVINQLLHRWMQQITSGFNFESFE